jgi:biopolymer transport protein ExbD
MEDKEFDYMNVLPLVDVMLVLLTIVLTTSTFIATGSISISLPKSTNTLTETASKDLIIEIDKYSNIYLNEIMLTLDGLKIELANKEKNTPVILKADKDIRLQVFIDVLDEIKRLGFETLSIQTEKRK